MGARTAAGSVFAVVAGLRGAGSWDAAERVDETALDGPDLGDGISFDVVDPDRPMPVAPAAVPRVLVAATAGAADVAGPVEP